MARKLLLIFVLLACCVCGAVGVFFALSPQEPEEPSGLSEERQQEIWAAEHATFRLETHFGQPFLDSLLNEEAGSAGRFFHDSLEADWPPLADLESPAVTRGGVTQSTSTKDDASSISGDAAALESRLRDALGRLGEIERTRLRILHIKPAGEGAWDTEVLLTAVGVDAEGKRLEHSSHHQVAFQGMDDESFEQTVGSWRIVDEKLTSSRDPFLVEVTPQAGLANLAIPDNWKLPVPEVTAYRFQSAVADFDNDGWLDIAIAVKRSPPMLLRGQGPGKPWLDVTKEVGIETVNVDFDAGYLACWFDLDNDGYQDLLLGDRLYRNVDGKQFKDITRPADLYLEYSPKGCVVADYDCDGLLDLYVMYDQAVDTGREVDGEARQLESWVGDGRSGAPNQLWRNEGGGHFLEVTGYAQADGGPRRTHAASWFYFNDDRFPDLYVVNDFGPNVLLVNRGDGTFYDATEAAGVGDFSTSMGVATGDLDNDGATEIYVANMYSKMGRRIIDYVGQADYAEGVYTQIQGSCAGNRLYWKTGKQYEENSEQLGVNNVGWAYGPTMFDVDSDGLLDIYATCGYLSFERSKPDG